MELNGLPAAPVAHLEAGQWRVCDPASWLRQSGGNLSVCITRGALFSQHGSTVYALDILSVNDLGFSD